VKLIHDSGVVDPSKLKPTIVFFFFFFFPQLKIKFFFEKNS